MISVAVIRPDAVMRAKGSFRSRTLDAMSNCADYTFIRTEPPSIQKESRAGALRHPANGMLLRESDAVKCKDPFLPV